MGIENYVSMEKYGVKEKSANLTKIELNSFGDYVVISTDDATLFDRFSAGYKHIADLSDSIPKRIKEIEKQYKEKDDFNSVMEKTILMSRVNVEFSKEAIAVVDGILGEGAVKKHFRRVYDEIPDFMPDADCFFDFFEKFTPIMEMIFNRKMDRMEISTKARMAKYQPQDHKKPKRKRASK